MLKILKILIADDNEIALGIVSEMLQQHEGWNVCARVANGRDAVAKTIELKPDVVILDLAMPEMDGLTAAREISKALPSAAILIYTLHEGDLIALEAKKAGVRRVISKMAAPENLVLAVEEVLRSEAKETHPAATAIPEIILPGPLGDANRGAVSAQPAESAAADAAKPDPPNGAN
jgi:DNA-binding NarL/FixJ family response regulator